ncbi:MAG: hypothetical protein K8R07_06250 [Desulfobacterales bacterium]|nr:hypothetical protein [Desulfobacterales bacterium]
MSQESASVELQERVVDSPSWIVSGSAATERLGGSASGVELSFSPQDATMKRLVNKRKLIKTRFFMILPSLPHQDLGTFLRKKSLNLGLVKNKLVEFGMQKCQVIFDQALKYYKNFSILDFSLSFCMYILTS